MKQKLAELKGKMNSFTITVEDFNTLLSLVDRTTRQNVSEETEDVSNTINQLDLTEHSVQQEHTHSSQVDTGHFPG